MYQKMLNVGSGGGGGETTPQTIRYDETSKYIQVCIRGNWYNYRYFNPIDPVSLIPTMTTLTTPKGAINISNNPISADDGYSPLNPTKGSQFVANGVTIWWKYSFASPVIIDELMASVGNWLNGTSNLTGKIELEFADGSKQVVVEQTQSVSNFATFIIRKVDETYEDVVSMTVYCTSTSAQNLQIASVSAIGYEL